MPEPAAAGLDKEPAAAVRRALAAGQLPAAPGHSRPPAWRVKGVAMVGRGMFLHCGQRGRSRRSTWGRDMRCTLGHMRYALSYSRTGVKL